MAPIIPHPKKIGKYMLIGDDIYERYRTDDVKVKAHDLGNGHTEIVGQSVYEYYEREFDNDTEGRRKKAALLREIKRIEERLANRSEEDLAERDRLNLERAAKRAKTRVRRLCKVMGANALMTLTFRENVTDLELTKKLTREFVRRLRRVLPDFRGVAGYEEQDRGAWHVHIGCERVASTLTRNGVKYKSYNLVRSIWRSVTRDLAGTVNFSAGKRNQTRSAAKIAAYLSKYITKAFADGQKYSNRFSVFGDVEIPRPVDLGTWPSLQAAFVGAYGLLSDADFVSSQGVSKWSDFFFVVAEKKDTSPPDTLSKT